MGGGIAGISGCLRLQDEASSTAEEPSTSSETSSDGAPSDDESEGVPLTESWTDEGGVDHIWTREGTFYYNDYNYAAEASHGDGVSWSVDTTYDGGDENLGADAFAANSRFVVFGYSPDSGADETRGAHFHAYRRYDGEEMWAVAAPSDGPHNLAAGATAVDGVVALAVSDSGEGDERDPLVYGVDIETGETRWQAGQPAIPAAYVRYLGSYDGDLYLGTTEGVQVLATETGEVTETYDSWYVGTARLESLGQIHGETLFAGWVETVEAHSLGDDGVSWSNAEVGRVSTTPAVDNSLVVVGTDGGDVYAFERGSGETRWEASITNSVGAIETTASRVWVGDTDIGLTAYDRETGSQVHRSTKPVNGDDIAVTDDVLLLGGDAATAYTID
jgi:outer membrane protein assembly factor BamB